MRVEDRNEVGADDEHLGRRVVDDEGDLGRRQPPVDVDAHGVAEGRAVEHLEVLDAVLVEEGDAVLRPDAGGPQAGGHPPRPLVQLGPRDAAVAERQRPRRRASFALCARTMSARPSICIAAKVLLVGVTFGVRADDGRVPVLDGRRSDCSFHAQACSS